jgi:hypothetical protein
MPFQVSYCPVWVGEAVHLTDGSPKRSAGRRVGLPTHISWVSARHKTEKSQNHKTENPQNQDHHRSPTFSPSAKCRPGIGLRSIMR